MKNRLIFMVELTSAFFFFFKEVYLAVMSFRCIQSESAVKKSLSSLDIKVRDEEKSKYLVKQLARPFITRLPALPLKAPRNPPGIHHLNN